MHLILSWKVKYVKWNNPAIASDLTKSIEDKRVENAPQYIHRMGATYYLKGFSATFQFSSVGNVLTDALTPEFEMQQELLANFRRKSQVLGRITFL